MKIVTIFGHYYIPVANGFKEISKEEAMYLYDTGAVTHEEDLTMEVVD